MPEKTGAAWNAVMAKALANGTKVQIRARGGSMRPFIPDGSLVEIVPLQRGLLVGDVVAAARDDRLFIHRVVSQGATIELMGDAAAGPDKPFAANDILGLARRVVTPGGWVMRLDTPAAAVVGTVAAWVAKTRSVENRS